MPIIRIINSTSNGINFYYAPYDYGYVPFPMQFRMNEAIDGQKE